MTQTDEIDLKSIAERVRRLEDLEGIKDLHARYAEVCDDGYDAQGIAQLFTEDCVWDGGETLGRVEGIEALREFFAGAGKRFTFAVHFMMAPRTSIATNGDSATGSWYLLEPCTIAEDGREEAFWVAAVYDAEYRKDSDGWRFHRLVVDTRMLAPHVGGWAGTNGSSEN
jgi:ketosteroid isomerase-like protein